MPSFLHLLIALLSLGLSGAISGEESRVGSTWEPSSDQVLLHRLTKILLHNSSRFNRPATEPVVAATCVLAPTISDFYDSNAAKLTSSAVASLPPLSLAKSSSNLKEVFGLLRQTKTGRAVLAKFEPKFGFEVKVDQFASAMNQADRRKASALFDLEKKTIYIDRKETIGNLAPILLHEMVHSLDKDYLRAVEREKELWAEFDRDLDVLLKSVARRTGKIAEELEESDYLSSELTDIVRMKLAMEQFRDVRVYRAERVAYDLYFDVLRELADQYPDFYIKKSRRLSSLHAFSDHELTRVEGLSGVTITKYRNGICRAFK